MLAPEVNRVKLSSGPDGDARDTARGLPLEGHLRRSRTGWLRGLQWATGVALLRCIGAGLAAVLGYRHPATLVAHPGSLELRGERRFMGLSLGATRQIVPLGAVRRIRFVGASGAWSVFAALAVLVVAGAVGTVLVLWGIAGRQPSWVELGATVVMCGVLLDAVAYLWVRRRSARGRATLEIRAVGYRFRLCGVSRQAADALLDEIRIARER
jgi:hypothetical protein